MEIALRIFEDFFLPHDSFKVSSHNSTHRPKKKKKKSALFSQLAYEHVMTGLLAGLSQGFLTGIQKDPFLLLLQFSVNPISFQTTLR